MRLLLGQVRRHVPKSTANQGRWPRTRQRRSQRVTRRRYRLRSPALPLLAARSDARPLAEGLRGLSGLRRRTAFVRTAHTVLDWRGQTVSASRQTNLLSDIPVLLAWGADDKTIPPRHQRAFADILPHAVTVEIAAAGHYPHETASTQLLPALITPPARVPTRARPDSTDRRTGRRERRSTHRRPRNLDPNAGRSL